MSARKLLSCTLLAALAACSVVPGDAALAGAPRSGETLKAFRDEAELVATLDRWRSAAEAARPAHRRSADAGAPATMNAQAMTAPMPAPAPGAATVSAAAGKKTEESITNVQTAGVDEGGIVKRAGDHLVVLRRGRLFTVRIGGGALRPVSTVDAYAPGVDPRGAWYDEMLISGSTVVVIGYSHARGGTEIGLFKLGDDGSLAYRSTHHLRSYDYYSSRNYASRLIGNRLVFYSPTILSPWSAPPMQRLPGYRRWEGPATPPEFRRILPATRIYRTDDELDPSQAIALHTVTSCELADAELRCESSAVLGPMGRVFYVSQDSVYVWTAAARRPPVMPVPAGDGAFGPPPRRLPTADSAVFRIPLDGGAPSGLKTVGAPVDQMSFLEGADGFLNVLVRQYGRGDGMWAAERSSGGMALLRVPLQAFGDGREAARAEHYRRLPDAQGWSVQNRFVGDWLLWSVQGPGRGAAQEAAHGRAWALRYAAAGAAVQPLAPGHGVERIEALGGDAALIGNDGPDLVFSALRLGRDAATPAGRHVQPGAAQGESRTHGFFYRQTGVDEGLLGLPIVGEAARRGGGPAIHGNGGGRGGAASVLFLRNRGLAFDALGDLKARPAGNRDDGCKASCVDWYGNARPVFTDQRVFALMGYEIVEGTLSGRSPGGRIDERRRISFAPAAGPGSGRFSPFEQ